MSRRAGAGRGLALGLVVVAVLEGLCRLAPPPDPRVPDGEAAEGTITLEGNPWLLWQLRPGERTEHGKPVHVNAQGFRGGDVGPPTGPRILALGDSSVYGFGVGDDEVFTARIEADLAAIAPGLSVVNGATPGWSTYQSLNMLDMRGWALDPDLLVIGNLWSDNNFDDFVDKDLLASYAGFTQSPGYMARRVLEHSSLFAWLDWELRVRPRGERAAKVGWTMGGDGPKSGKRRVAINDYADNLDTLCARARERGSGVVFVTLANREDVNPQSHDPAWGPYRQVMKDAATRHGVPLVEMPLVVRTAGHAADALFMDQMHPTALGHRFLGEAVEAALRGAGWPGDRLVPAEVGPHERYVDRFEGRGVDPHR